MIEYYKTVTFTHNGYREIAIVRKTDSILSHSKVSVFEKFEDGSFLSDNNTIYKPLELMNGDKCLPCEG